MKYILTLCAYLLFVPLFTQSQVINTFTHFSQGSVNAPAFTSNNFKCIAVGDDNIIWAGTQYGGLYLYDGRYNLWTKSAQLTNVSINDIKADPDSGIWIAQSGQQSAGGNSSIAGGINYFPVASDNVNSMRFFSVAGTTTSADLLSRNVRSLYIDKSVSSLNGQLPRVWAAQGTYITSFNTRRGGLSVGLNPFATYFTNYSAGYATGTAATPISEAVAGNSEEVWTAARQNNGGSQILRYKPSGEYIGIHGTADTTLFQPGFTVQAIHFDAAGNRWLGLKTGGLIVKTPLGWQKMDAPSLIAAGTQINYNAITSDEFGNVYIGTSNGMLEYLSRDYHASSSPDYTPSYNLYTTGNGMLSNNITGLAYDKKNGKLLITTDAGVTFMNKREPFIKGVVFDVFCNPDQKDRKYSGLQKIPLVNGITVTLLKDGVEEESAYPDANGIFELKQANETDTYSVEVKFVKEGKTMRYNYGSIRNHTLMEPVLMPDSLIRELKSFKAKLQNRCFPVKISLDIEIPNLMCADGFDVNGYELAIDGFYAPVIDADHKKRVDNLAGYYTSLAAVYKLGGNVVDLATDGLANLFDAVDAMRSTLEFSYAMKYPDTDITPDEALEETYKSLALSSLKLIKEGVSAAMKFGVSKLDPEGGSRKVLDKCVAALNESADVLIEMLENGRNQGLGKIVLDNMKKIVSLGVAIDYYRDAYARETHAHLVYESSNAAKYLTSDYDYSVIDDNVYNPNTKSIVKYATDTLTNRKKLIEVFAAVAKYSDMASTGLEGASALAVILGGPAAAAVLRGFALAAKYVKAAALASAMYQGGIGAWETQNLSKKIPTEAGLLRQVGSGSARPPSVLQGSPDSLIAIKNRFNQRLTELQVIYNAAVYDSLAYFFKYRQLRKEDSVYTAEMVRTTNALLASVDTAIAKVPGFADRMGRVIDSFVTQQYILRYTLKFQNLGFFYDTDKSNHRPGLDSLATELRITNDSAVNGIVGLINMINTSGIAAGAYLVQEGYVINHSRVPGSSGTVTYTFKNYGGVTQNNVSFKISHPTGGYTITSADSVNVGAIAAGQLKQVSFTFTSPIQDSAGHYTIDVKAGNGYYTDVFGSFYVIDPTKFYTVKNGNWNDPATWSGNAVPASINSVYISHTVTVTADANCKTITVNKPGNVIVNTGRRINVMR